MKKTVNIDGENLHIDLRNFNEIFRKDVTYDNIKSHKKPRFPLSLEDKFFEKPLWGWVKKNPQTFYG